MVDSVGLHKTPIKVLVYLYLSILTAQIISILSTIVCKNVLEIVSTHLLYLFPPPPLTMLIFYDRTNFWNTEIVIFNIDMGEGGRTVYLLQRNIENYAFSKNFCS